MYSVRVQNRLPQAYRVCRAAPVPYNTTREMALFPRLVANEFAPMFRLMDDYASHLATRGGFNSTISNSFRSFQPRFDVRETSEAYELHGELPGIDQKDINIEFTDSQTLSIKGRSETHREEGTRPGSAAAAPVEAQAEPARLPEAETKAASEAGESSQSETSSYHKPTVEDEANPDAEYVSVEAPAEQSIEASEVPKKSAVATSATASEPAQQEQPTESSQYWVSERSVGTFQRFFAFPSRIDQGNVTASLKNGILSIVVPKAAPPASRRINIQ